MDLLLGLDVGTTATKALLLSIDGEVVASAVRNYALATPQEDWVEQDPADFWRAVVVTCQELNKRIKPDDHIIALSISSQAGTTIPVGANGEPLGNALSWMDHRAHEESKQIRQSIGAEKVYETSGWQLGDGLPLLHISWLRRHKPEVFASARRFVFVNDFIIHKLTGQYRMDPSDAGITQLYNIATGQWDRDMLELAGIGSDQLSPIMDSGEIVGQLTEEASRETGLPPSVLVVNGAHDQYCAALGSGVLEPGTVMLSCGTAWVILCVMKKLRLDPEMRLSISRHAVKGKIGALRSMGGVGACMEWFVEKLWDGKSNSKDAIYSEINKAAGAISVGSNGLVYLPASGGYGRGTRGAFLGLTLSHTRAEMARSIMEGIVYELSVMMEDIKGAGIEATELRMVGGAAGSPVWSQIVSDVTELPVVIPSTAQAASLGAAILAGMGSGVFPDAETGYRRLSGKEKVLEPNALNAEEYKKLLLAYRAVSRKVYNSFSLLPGG